MDYIPPLPPEGGTTDNRPLYFFVRHFLSNCHWRGRAAGVSNRNSRHGAAATGRPA
jgi:hypothetical protein